MLPWMRIQYGMNTGQVQVFLFARQMLIRNDHIYNTFIMAIPAGEQTKKSGLSSSLPKFLTQLSLKYKVRMKDMKNNISGKT